jgi:hypothetical protein
VLDWTCGPNPGRGRRDGTIEQVDSTRIADLNRVGFEVRLVDAISAGTKAAV